MADRCKGEYQAMLARLDQVIRDKWPETLRGDGSGVWAWVMETRAETLQKLNGLRKRLEVAWLNGMFDEMKSLTLEWGKLNLEIFREYSLHLKRMETV